MADIQIVTGFAILISGYTTRTGLSAVHWKMVVYLAWFSCSSHLSALIFLRNYLINRPAARFWRLTSMFALLLCVTVALVPTGHFFWDELTEADPFLKRYSWIYEANDKIYNSNSTWLFKYSFEAPPAANATCYFNSQFTKADSRGLNSMIVSIILLICSFITRLLKLHRYILWIKVESISRHLIDRILGSASTCQRWIGTSRFEDRLNSNMLVAAHFVVCIWIDFYTSMASDVSIFAFNSVNTELIYK